jgi:NAD dependent epimerase/dehydratase
MLRGAAVLVTGAGGFIGSHLCERLVAQGADVTAMIRYKSTSDWGNLEFLSCATRGRLKVVSGDVNDSDFVANVVMGKDMVFHLAALIAIPYSYIAPRSYFRTNVEGTLNVMEACRRSKVAAIVHTSTSEVYGSAQYTPIDEHHPLQGQSPYSASKIGADKLVESYARSFDLPVVTLRPFNTFGPRQSARAVIPTIISQAVASDIIRLGSLDTIRDLTDVDDTVAGFIAAATAARRVPGQEINLGVGKAISIGDLARRILDVMNVTKPIITEQNRTRPLNSEVDRLLSDNTKARTLLGWYPKVALDDGLAATVPFIEENIAKFRHSSYTL